MNTGTRRKNWQEALWMSASALLIAAVAMVAALAGVLVLVRGNAVPTTVVVAVGQQNGGSAMSDNYNPASIGVNAGDTVRWEWFGGTHDVVSYAETSPGVPEWQSNLIRASGHFFERQFSVPGTYTYYCSIHAPPEDAAPSVIDNNIAAGKMVGKVVVSAPATPTPSPTPSPTPASPSATPTPVPSGTGAPTASPSPTGSSPSPSLTPVPSSTASPDPPSTPTPGLTGSPTPEPTVDPQPSDTPEPSSTPEATPSPEPTDVPSTAATQTPTAQPSVTPTYAPQPTTTATAAATPTASATSTLAPAAGGVNPTPPPVAGGTQPKSVLGGTAPGALPQTGAATAESGLSKNWHFVTMSLTGLLIAVVISGFIWIERAGRSDQPR